jgi:hypothetical protein
MQWNLRIITDATGINGNGTVILPAPTTLALGYHGWTTWITNVAGTTGNTVTIDAAMAPSCFLVIGGPSQRR